MRVRNAGAGILAAALTTSIVMAAPAGATVIEKFQEKKVPYSFINEDCDGARYDVSGVFTGRFIGKEGKGPATEAFPFLDRHSFVETWTNIDTGQWFTLTANRIFNEVKARPVDGTVFRFWAIQSGRTVVEDSDGDRVASDSGVVRITYLFDTLGDGEPGGEYFWETWMEDFRGSHEIGDLCALADELTS